MSIRQYLGLEDFSSNPDIEVSIDVLTEEVAQSEAQLEASVTELGTLEREVTTLESIYNELGKNYNGVISSESNRFMNIALESVFSRHNVSLREVNISLEDGDKAKTDKGMIRKVISAIWNKIKAIFRAIVDFFKRIGRKIAALLGFKLKETDKLIEEVAEKVADPEKKELILVAAKEEVAKVDTKALIVATTNELVAHKEKIEAEEAKGTTTERVDAVDEIIKTIKVSSGDIEKIVTDNIVKGVGTVGAFASFVLAQSDMVEATVNAVNNLPEEYKDKEPKEFFNSIVKDNEINGTRVDKFLIIHVGDNKNILTFSGTGPSDAWTYVTHDFILTGLKQYYARASNPEEMLKRVKEIRAEISKARLVETTNEFISAAEKAASGIDKFSNSVNQDGPEKYVAWAGNTILTANATVADTVKRLSRYSSDIVGANNAAIKAISAFTRSAKN